jgi:hypothetical protein
MLYHRLKPGDDKERVMYAQRISQKKARHWRACDHPDGKPLIS